MAGKLDRWLDTLNDVANYLEEHCNFGDEESEKVIKDLDKIIDEMYNQKRKKDMKSKWWNEAIKAHIEAQKDIK